MAAALYVLESAQDPFGPGGPLFQPAPWPSMARSAVKRAAALGCSAVQIGDPTGTVTAFPAVLVVTTMSPAPAAPSVVSDTTAQATAADVTAALAPILSAEASAVTALENAQQTVSGLQPQMDAYQTQIQADLTAVASWSTLTATEQADIMGRVIQGFGTLMQALYSHALLTKTVP